MSSVAEILEQERSKYLALDEDEILDQLSEHDLNQLKIHMQDIDPDNQLLPAGLRQSNHTDKEATGPLDRDQLLNYIEDEAKKLDDVEDVVPFTPGVKRGKIWQGSLDENPLDDPNNLANLDPELEECINNASDGELTDIAAILGMHSLVRNDQYNVSYTSNEKIVNKSSMSSTTKCELVTTTANEPPNPTDVEDTLEKVKNNDAELTEVNMNNIKNVPIHILLDYCEALKTNTHVKSWSIANTRSNDKVAKAIAEMLLDNISLKILNVESNFISNDGVYLIVESLKENCSLEQLRVDNQRSRLGSKFEHDVCEILKENKTLLKFGYQFQSQGPRNQASKYLTRNQDLRRQRRRAQSNK